MIYIYIYIYIYLFIYLFALEFAIRKVQETNLGLDMNGTRQVLVYADDLNFIGDDIRTIGRNADVEIVLGFHGRRYA